MIIAALDVPRSFHLAGLAHLSDHLEPSSKALLVALVRSNQRLKSTVDLLGPDSLSNSEIRTVRLIRCAFAINVLGCTKCIYL